MDQQLKEETLVSACEYIKRIIQSIDLIYINFQQSKDEEGIEILGQFIEGLHWLEQAITLTKDIQRNPIDTSEINGILNQIEGLFAAKDYFTMSDILLYELKPVLEIWNNKLDCEIGESH